MEEIVAVGEARDRHHGRNLRGLAGAARGIEQVNRAVVQMDEMTQQNAALVEEAAAAAKSMEDQTGSMAEMVGQFRLADGFAAAPAQSSDGAVKIERGCQ